MIRRSDEKTVEVKKMFNGDGQAVLTHILNGADEMYGKGRVFSMVHLDPDCEVGWHIHQGDGETYFILRGRGLYSDNGESVEVGPGDVTFVDAGEGHSLRCLGDEPLEAIALILFKD